MIGIHKKERVGVMHLKTMKGYIDDRGTKSVIVCNPKRYDHKRKKFPTKTNHFLKSF